MKNKPSHRLFSKLSFKLLKKDLGDFKTRLLSMFNNPLTCLNFHDFQGSILLRGSKATFRKTRTRCKICSKLTKKTPEQCHWLTCVMLTLNM